MRRTGHDKSIQSGKNKSIEYIIRNGWRRLMLIARHLYQYKQMRRHIQCTYRRHMCMATTDADATYCWRFEYIYPRHINCHRKSAIEMLQIGFRAKHEVKTLAGAPIAWHPQCVTFFLSFSIQHWFCEHLQAQWLTEMDFSLRQYHNRRS